MSGIIPVSIKQIYLLLGLIMILEVFQPYAKAIRSSSTQNKLDLSHFSKLVVDPPPHPDPGPPNPHDQHDRADGEKCFRNYECISSCCLPDLFANGTVKHYDKHGFPVRVCFEADGHCKEMNTERIWFYGVIALALLLISCLVYCWRRHQ